MGRLLASSRRVTTHSGKLDQTIKSLYVNGLPYSISPQFRRQATQFCGILGREKKEVSMSIEQDVAVATYQLLEPLFPTDDDWCDYLYLVLSYDVPTSVGVRYPSVDCSDVFMWGCADAEEITECTYPFLAESVERYTQYQQANPGLGAAFHHIAHLYASLVRGMQPMPRRLETEPEWAGLYAGLPENLGGRYGDNPPTGTVYPEPRKAPAVELPGVVFDPEDVNLLDVVYRLYESAGSHSLRPRFLTPEGEGGTVPVQWQLGDFMNSGGGREKFVTVDLTREQAAAYVGEVTATRDQLYAVCTAPDNSDESHLIPYVAVWVTTERTIQANCDEQFTLAYPNAPHRYP